MPEESFRDHSGLISKEGKRVWMYPKKVKGKWMKYRSRLSWLLLSFYFILPLIKFRGEPFFMFNIIERKFVLFGAIFWPQDSYLFFLGMISLVIFIVLFTVIFGRLWCGWACPQTIFMEMVFRKLEYLIEGSATEQRKLKYAPIWFRKLRIKLTKHVVFWLVALLIGVTFFAYILSMDRIIEVFRQPFISENYTLFLVVIIFSTVIYFVYSQVRELVCTIICPYGRLQGALVDQHSMIVAYDYIRGEPKGTRQADNGDCIDCKQCVSVCPTGIDIRNGTQIECVNCAACIDACDAVMTKVKKPQGLIRYVSLDQIRKGEKFKLSTRGYAYSLVLILILIFLGYMFISRTPIESIILRTPGLIYQKQKNNEISNLYNINIVNKSRKKYTIHLSLLNAEGKIKIVGDSLIIKPHGSTNGVFFIFISREVLKTENNKLEIGVFDGKRLLEKHETTFVGPEKKVKSEK